MKIKILGLALLLNMNVSLAGDKGGNGGGAHVCYTDETYTTMIGAESHDLWEGRRLHKLPIPYWDGKETKEEIIKRILAKIAMTQPGVVREMKKALAFLNKEGTIEDAKDVELQYVPDANLLYTGKNCKYKQMVNWLDQGDYLAPDSDRIFRENDFYQSHLNPLDQASLDIHEVAYKVYRTFAPGAVEKHGSIGLRKFVAQAFSTTEISIKLARSEDIEYGVHTKLIAKHSAVMIVADPAKCSPQDFTVKHTWLENLDGKRARPSVYMDNKGYALELKLGETKRLNFEDVTLEAFGGAKVVQIYSTTAHSNLVSFELEGCGLSIPVFKSLIKGSILKGEYKNEASAVLRIYFSDGTKPNFNF